MRARKLVYSLMVSGPVVLLLAIAIQAHFVPAPEAEALVRPDGEAARVMAYSSAVAATTALTHARQHDSEPTELDAVAAVWEHGYRTGRLRPLLPNQWRADQEGVKSEIGTAGSTMVHYLRLNAQSLIEEGDPAGAADRLLLAVEICELVKYTEPLVLQTLARTQIRLLKEFDKLMPDVPLGTRMGFMVRANALLNRQPNARALLSSAEKYFLDVAAEEPAYQADAGHMKWVVISAATPGDLGGAAAKLAQAVEGHWTGARFYVQNMKDALDAQARFIRDLSGMIEDQPWRLAHR